MIRKHPVYRAVIERDKDGYWFVDFPEIAGCHTQARTLGKARERMREALSLYVADADTVEIVEEVRLPGRASELLEASRTLRAKAADTQQEAQSVTTEAARELRAAGLTMRDAGELLGLSLQRVHQLVS